MNNNNLSNTHYLPSNFGTSPREGDRQGHSLQDHAQHQSTRDYHSFMNQQTTQTNPFDQSSWSQASPYCGQSYNPPSGLYDYSNLLQPYNPAYTYAQTQYGSGQSLADCQSLCSSFLNQQGSLGNPFNYPAQASSSQADFPIKNALKDILKTWGASDTFINMQIDEALEEKALQTNTTTLNTDEYVALAMYSGELHNPLNKLLIEQPSQVDHPVAQAILSGLHKLAENPENRKTHVYRGMDKSLSDAEVKKMFKPGKTYSDAGFMSTTASRERADRYTTLVQLNIDSRSAVSIKSISGLPHEEEALIPPNTQFKVKSLKKQGAVWHVNLKEK